MRYAIAILLGVGVAWAMTRGTRSELTRARRVAGEWKARAASCERSDGGSMVGVAPPLPEMPLDSLEGLDLGGDDE